MDFALPSLNRRLAAFFQGDPGPLLDAAALVECDVVIHSLQHTETADPLACSVAGSVIWYQHEHDPKRTGAARFATAVSMLTLVVADDPGAVPIAFLNELLESEAADADTVVRRLLAVAEYLMSHEGPAAKQFAEHRFALAYDLLSDAHPDKAAVGRLLARVNGFIYDDTGDRAPLDKAIDIAHEALRSARDTDLKLDIAYRLGIDLRKRFRRAGDQADLDLSQHLCSQLIRAVPEEDPRYADYIASYAQTLHQRASLRKSRPELDRVIRLSHRAVELTDPGHEFYLHRLDGLAGALAERAALADEPPTPEVVDMFRQVRHQAAPDTDIYLRATHNLAAALLMAHRREPDPAKLREAMALSEETMRLTPAADQDRWSTVITQSALLVELAADDADHHYLDHAIALTEQVLGTVADHPVKRIDVMDALARHLYHRWILDPARAQELRRALDLWRTIGRERDVAPQKRAHILTHAVRLTRRAADATATLPVFLDLIDSIRMQMWDEHDHQTQMDVLGRHAVAAAAEGAACAVELNDTQAAVRILESGRALTWNRSWDLRDELEKIPDTAPGLKAKIQSELMIADMSVSSDTSSTVVDQMKNRAGASIARLIHQVRALTPSPTLPEPPNFYFLPDRSDLTRATADGPVVYVNYTPGRCDALIVHDGDTIPYSFPFTSSEFTDVANDFARTERGDRFDRDLTANLLLEWLWDHGFADLIALLRRRGCITGQRDRVWWCPTGLFSFLPLHAIGKTGGTDGVADHLISSYTSSLKSLRRLRTPPWKFTKTNGLLAITIKDTPGCPQCYSWPPLETAERERRFLLDTFGPERITDLHGPEATRANILNALRHHRRFHFSGHGVQTHIAHHSGMIPYDWERTKKQVSVTDIAQLPNFGGDLAFLGASVAVPAEPRRWTSRALNGEGANMPAMWMLMTRPIIVRPPPWCLRCTGAIVITATMTRLDTVSTASPGTTEAFRSEPSAAVGSTACGPVSRRPAATMIAVNAKANAPNTNGPANAGRPRPSPARLAGASRFGPAIAPIVVAARTDPIVLGRIGSGASSAAAYRPSMTVAVPAPSSAQPARMSASDEAKAPAATMSEPAIAAPDPTESVRRRPNDTVSRDEIAAAAADPATRAVCGSPAADSDPTTSKTSSDPAAPVNDWAKPPTMLAPRSTRRAGLRMIA